MSYLGQAPGQGQAEYFLFTASGNETSVTTADDGRVVSYTVGQVSVYLNGVKLVEGSGKDFQATNGSTITGLSALTASDVVEVVALSAFSPSDTVSAANGGTFAGNVTHSADLRSGNLKAADGTASITIANSTGLVTAPALKLTPTATGSAPSGSEGSLYYDSTKNSLMYYDTSWQKISGTQASGGTISFYSTYKVHTFKADGTFIVEGGDLTFDIFLIGGGGASVGDNGGGGGAGGLVWKAGYTTSPGSFAIQVGAGATGGAGGSSPAAGEDSTFASTIFIAKGGGHGGSYGTDAGDGGCGGGAGRTTGGGSTKGDTIQSSSGQAQGGTSVGFDGGAGRNHAEGPGGGGGGTAGVGSDGDAGTVGNGGVGHSTFVGDAASTAALLWSAQAGTNSSNAAVTSLTSSPNAIYIGGGGGGGTQDRTEHGSGGNGGDGGGGSIGDASQGSHGMVNTGSGGGSTTSGGGTGGNGGSGIVIIRYAI